MRHPAYSMSTKRPKPARPAPKPTGPTPGPDGSIRFSPEEWAAFQRHVLGTAEQIGLRAIALRDRHWQARQTEAAIREAELRGQLDGLRARDAGPRVREVVRDHKDRIVGVVDRPAE